MNRFKSKADCSRTDAIVAAAYAYHFGVGVKRDFARAKELYEKAAGLGDSRAMFNLGCMFSNGDGVDKDDFTAMAWYLKAADAGDSKAMCRVAIMYDNGEGCMKDAHKAVEWFEKAAENGNSDAVSELACMDCCGDSVFENKSKAENETKYRKILNGYLFCMIMYMIVVTLFPLPALIISLALTDHIALLLPSGIAFVAAVLFYQLRCSRSRNSDDDSNWYKYADKTRIHRISIGSQIAIDLLEIVGMIALIAAFDKKNIGASIGGAVVVMAISAALQAWSVITHSDYVDEMSSKWERSEKEFDQGELERRRQSAIERQRHEEKEAQAVIDRKKSRRCGIVEPYGIDEKR